MKQLDIYTTGEMLDKLKVNQYAIKVQNLKSVASYNNHSVPEIGEAILYYNQEKDGLLCWYLYDSPVYFSRKPEEKDDDNEMWIIVDNI